MKQFKWIPLALGAALLLSACGGPRPSDPVPQTPELPEEASQTAPSPEENGKAARLAFGALLWDAYQQGILPDGTALEHTGPEAAAENSFALGDVDGDGREELVLVWSNACMAGMGEYVFGFDGESVHQELVEFPGVSYYENGAAKADWSHNQGRAGRIWPYNVYRCDPEQDIYQMAGALDAWDKSIIGEQPFPEDIDADGDGLVYYLLPAGWAGQYDMDPVDGEAYDAWRQETIGDAEPIHLDFQSLTEAHIAALGAPRPEASQPQPVG